MNKYRNRILLLAIPFYCFLLSGCRNEKERLPQITGSFVSSVGSSSVFIGTIIADDIDFPVTQRGVYWGKSDNLLVSGNKISGIPEWGEQFISVKGLEPGTQYFIMAYATNNAGTVYGNKLSFTTLNGVSDIDGNLYNIVAIGDQVWMQENLHVTKYRNGDPVTRSHTGDEWTSRNTEAYCIYNDMENDATYGGLYNWYAVTDSRLLCPTGWHVPSGSEWTELEDYLGGASVAGGKMKEQGSINWDIYNIAAINSSGFTALPAGTVGYNGYSYYRDYSAFFWSPQQINQDSASFLQIKLGSGKLFEGSEEKHYGFSVRCVKD